ncbi:ATP-binding protein [Candidatus Latescibacterota bacterium]
MENLKLTGLHRISLIYFTLLLVLVVSVADYLTGTEISFSIFYLLPVSLVSWYLTIWYGIGFSIICSVLWLINDFIGGHSYSNNMYIFWNTAVRGIIFIITALLLSKLKHFFNIEKKLRNDAMTASSLKSDFLANMSHEIRTPLNAILGTAEVLSEHDLTEEQHEYVQIVRKEGDHLLKIINDILDLSKIEAGQFTFEKIAFNLSQLIEEVSSLMGARVRQKGLEFTYSFMPDVPKMIIGDADVIRRIIINLIGNAIKFTHSGTISLCIDKVVDETHLERLKFSVSDTGIGIPKEKLKLIFERFNQADASITRSYGGTGLGLSISKKMAEMTGGSLCAESDIGQGSTFIYSIPLETPEITEKSASLTDDYKAETEAMTDMRRLTILLVEDYEANRRIIEAFLKATPYILDCVENGKIAVEKIKVKDYDLVLMDIQMPVMDGYEATKIIRTWEKKKKLIPVPIIALTAHAYKEDIRKSVEVGCNDHLTKPLSKIKLLNAIYENTKVNQQIESIRDHKNEEISVLLPSDMKSLIPGFLQEMNNFCHTMREAAYHNDFTVLKEISHKIKGAGGSYGFDTISSFGKSIEEASMNNDMAEIKMKLDEFLHYLVNVEVTYE